MALRYAVSADWLRTMPARIRTRLLDDDHSGTEDVGLCDIITEDAADYVDAFLDAAGLSTPVTDSPTPPAIKHATVWKAKILAYERMNAADEGILAQDERIEALLAGFVEGRRGTGQDPPPAASETRRASVESDDRIFSRTTLGVM